MAFMHVMYTYQSRNQRHLLRKKINYLIEKYKHNKDVQKLKLEVEELRKLRTSQIPDINQNLRTEISETFVTAEMDNGTPDGGTSDVQAMTEHDCAPLVALESEELIAADVEIVLNSALDNIEKEMINMCEVEIQVDVSDFVEKDELVGLDEDEMNLVEAQIKQEQEDRKHEEEYAKMELVLQNNLMRTKDYAEDEAGKLIQKVKNVLAAVSELKKGLCAIRQKDIDEIKKIAEEIDNSDWIRILRERYADSSLAQRLADDLERMRSRCNLLMEKFADMLRMRAKIEELKQSTIAEIRSYSDPPASVGEVMRATFLLLGESYSDMQKWSNIRVLLGKMGKRAVKHRILNFDLTSLKGKYVTVKRAKILCRDQTLAEIESVSVGAAVFFSWCMVTIDAFETLA